MLTRRSGYLTLRDEHDPVLPAASHELQREGFTLLEQVFDAGRVAALSAEIHAVFDDVAPDVRSTRVAEGHFEPFRYEMLNRSALAQEAVADPAILSVVEPLLGEDCHVIANTAWRQPPDEDRHGGRFWHLDAGPHVPRPADVPWDERIPYPIFAVACHIFLMDCPLESGPTGVIPRSHTSGQAPPRDRIADEALTWEGRAAVPIVARAGDVSLFVSDAWHRRLPSRAGDPGRFFLQVHYGRRDLAQRLRTTEQVNHLSPDAITRAVTPRQRTLIGLHTPASTTAEVQRGRVRPATAPVGGCRNVSGGGARRPAASASSPRSRRRAAPGRVPRRPSARPQRSEDGCARRRRPSAGAEASAEAGPADQQHQHRHRGADGALHQAECRAGPAPARSEARTGAPGNGARRRVPKRQRRRGPPTSSISTVTEEPKAPQ